MEIGLAVTYPLLTHPDFASLADPLFTFGGKRVKKKNYFYFPLFCLQKRGAASEAKSG
jgi:hypothetical protein